jgi:hypothetical protein
MIEQAAAWLVTHVLGRTAGLRLLVRAQVRGGERPAPAPKPV